ncbi:MAG: hypothetical protein WC753_00095 [Candidatus Gracilibacteria bacterium]
MKRSFLPLLKYIVPIFGIVGVSLVMGNTPGLTQIGQTGSYYQQFNTYITGQGAQNILVNLFFILAGILFIVAVIVAFFAAIRLFVSDNSGEDFSKWAMTLTWSIVGLLLVSFAYGILYTFEHNVLNYNVGFNIDTIYEITVGIVYPILNFLRYIAAIMFFIVLIFAFYKIIIAGGDEEGFQNGKKTFIAAAMGFIIMVLAEPIVRMVYGGYDCHGKKFFGIPTECVNRQFNPDGFFNLVIKIIIFLNGFIALVTVIMIMYAGFLVLTGGGDEEKSEKAKKTILYAIIGVLIILFSYVIYRAFLFNIT